jgi:hypothetical protein
MRKVLDQISSPKNYRKLVFRWYRFQNSRYWLGIWYDESAWKTGGRRGLLPTRECPQMT